MPTVMTVAERAAWLLLLITMGIAGKEASSDLSVIVLYALGVAHGAALVALYSRTGRAAGALDSKKTDETPRPVLKGSSSYKPPAAEITMSVDDFESLRLAKARRQSVSGTPGSRKSPRTPKSASRLSSDRLGEWSR